MPPCWTCRPAARCSWCRAARCPRVPSPRSRGCTIPGNATACSAASPFDPSLMSTIPSHPAIGANAQDLTDEEFAELDELLLATPEPLEPVDAVMLDGYLCGVLVQPVLLESATWLAHVFDFDGRPLPDDVDAAWRDRTTSLILRRYAALNRAMLEDGWFDPLVLELDDEAAQEPLDPSEPGA